MLTNVLFDYISNILDLKSIGIFQEYQYLVAKYIQEEIIQTYIYLFPHLYNCNSLSKFHISSLLKVLNGMGFIDLIKNNFGYSVSVLPKYSLELLNVILGVIYGF